MQRLALVFCYYPPIKLYSSDQAVVRYYVRTLCPANS